MPDRDRGIVEVRRIDRAPVEPRGRLLWQDRLVRARIGTLRAGLADHRIRRIHLSFAGFSLAEHATWWATLVYAFDRGGVGGAGRLAVVSLVAAMLFAPFAAWSGDRFRPDRALLAGYLVQAVVAAAAAAAMYVDVPWLAYTAAVVLVCTVSMSRPLVGALLPYVVSRPADLVAGNVIIGSVGQLGVFLGPLLAAALMFAGSPAFVFAVSSGLLALGALAMFGARAEHLPSSTTDAGRVVASVFAGLTSVFRVRSLSAVVALMFTGALIGGVADVAIVTFSEVRLDGGGGMAGVLGASIGLGGVIGIVSMTEAAGRSPIAAYLAAASLTAGLPIAALAATDSAIIAAALLATSGVGVGVIVVLGTVAIQRLASEETLARVFGVQESARMAALAVGAGVSTVTIDRLGIGPALVWLGAGVTVAALACTLGFVRSGADVPAPDPDVVDRIVADELFAPLGVRAIERLAESAERTVRPVNTELVTEGDIGRRYFLLLDGDVEVRANGSLVRRLGAGDSFGEIALLEDRPRTATVRATTEVTALVIERDRFLTAVTGHPRAMSNASQIVDGYVR